MVEKLVKIKLITGEEITAWWDEKAFCWRKYPTGEEIEKQKIVGFTELNFSFPK